MKLFNALVLVITAAATANAIKTPHSYTRSGYLAAANSNIHGRKALVTKEYTVNADFAEGTLINTNFDETPDQLQLDSESQPFDFIWVAASGRGTVVKIDTNTGDILAEFRSTPLSQGWGNPSRTTVDRDGSVWLTNRNDVYDGSGSVVHIGLVENNQCEDRNGNGIIDTSTGLGDIKDWADASGDRGVATADDECIVHYTKVNSSGTRHVSVTSENDVWVSGFSLRNFDLVKGGRYDVAGSGSIVREETSVGYGGYGGLIDPNGVIWSANNLLRWDTANPLDGANGDPAGDDIGPPVQGTTWSGQSGDSYGLCIDSAGNVWNTQLRGNLIHKYAPDGTFLGAFSHGSNNAQGCVVGDDDDVYVAHSLFSATTVGHIKNDGTYVGNIDLAGGVGPTGVAVDRNGKIWSANIVTNTVSRIDPTLGPLGADGVTHVGEVDLTVDLGTGADPYNYSDMTGSTLIQPPTSGTWTVIYNGEWQGLAWNADVPNGASLTVQARSSTDASNWTQWVTTTNGGELALAEGEYLQVQVSFERPPDTNSPVLFDLSVMDNGPPVAQDDAATTLQGTPVTIDVTSNDSDPDGDTLTVGPCTTPANGTVSLGVGGVTYTPDTGFVGTDVFNCTVCDGEPLCDTGVVTVTVTAEELTPTVPPVTDPQPFDFFGILALIGSFIVGLIGFIFGGIFIFGSSDSSSSDSMDGKLEDEVGGGRFRDLLF